MAANTRLLASTAMGAVLAAFVMAGALVPTTATATVFSWSAVIDGSQEVPPVATPGTGSASGTINDASELLTWNISWEDLSGPAVAMHFHGPAPPGVNAGVQVNIGDISGLTSPSTGSTTISEAQTTDLLAGLWYINIHTELHPPGEIRGQVLITGTVAEPLTLALLGLGLAGLGFARRRVH